MKLYIDVIIIINFFFDFFLLLFESLLLKRNIKLRRIILGGLVGGISVISLFISFNSFSLFLFKIVVSIIMVLITFSYKNIKYTINNLLYLYFLSIILGGFLYFINNELSYKNVGLIFYHNGFSINWIIILIATPISLFIYIYNARKLKEDYSKRYEVKITFINGKISQLTGFLDSGNNLIDPYKKRPIIMINKDILGDYKPRTILVPCMTINKESMIKCFRIKELLINNKLIKKEVLVGISDNNFNIEGVDLLLHKNIF